MNKLDIYTMTYLNAFNMYNNNEVEKDVLSGINIKEEYELIQLKKYKLSSNLRRLVVLRWENDLLTKKERCGI